MTAITMIGSYTYIRSATTSVTVTAITVAVDVDVV